MEGEWNTASGVMTSSPGYDADAEIDEVILRLDLTLVRPDDDDGAGPAAAKENDHDESKSEREITSDSRAMTADSSGSSVADADRKKSKPLDFIRKLRQAGHQAESHDNAIKRKSPEPLKIDNLPQKFIAKYIGRKSCRGLWGIQHTREPVDALVDDIRRLERGEDLPLVCLDVSIGGIGVAVHPRSRSRQSASHAGLLPLQFISYAVQDTRYSRIFAFIVLRELSSRARSTECHAYLCDSPVSARKLALSVALAFRLYERSLAGKPFRFTVDLRSPDELAAERANGKSKFSTTSSKSASAALATEFDA